MATPTQQELNNLNDQFDLLEDKLNNIGSLLQDKLKNKISDLKDESRDFVDKLAKGQDVTKQISSKLLTLQKDINKLSLKRNDLENDLLRAQQRGLTQAAASIQTAINKNKLATLLLEDLQTQLLTLSKIAEEEKKITEEKKKQDSLLEIAKKKLKDINATYLSTLGILKFILDAALRFNDISVKTGKDLGYGADQADRVTSNLVSAARVSGNLNFTLKNAAAAMGELNAATGGVAEYSADTLETQIMLTKQFGLAGDEAAGIYKFSVLTGKASSVVNKEMAGSFASTRNMVRGSANFKTTMAEVAKTSGQLAINFKNNPAAITAAVVQAQALGTTLEQARDQGKQLLDFESSIENELRAELLTGQQMNLERARAAALMGDQVTVMKELNNQGMTLEKFQNMNVVAQESFAKALGLSSDQLSEQLRKQKIAQEQGKSLAEITQEEALEAEKRQAIQDKFNAAIEKLQDLIGNLVAGPVGWFLETLTAILPLVTYIAAGFATIYALSKGMMLFEKLKLGFLVGQKAAGMGYNSILIARQVLMSGELAKAVGIAAAYAIANPIQALIGLGVAAAAGALIYSLTKADDMVSPGYGKRTILSPEGSIALNDKDTIIAGTNLGGGGETISPPISSSGGGETISPSIDLTPMIVAINQVKASIDRLYSKDSTIQMGAKTVGTTLSQTSTKLA
jgi:hypothetical protein